jgi:hypothetical protein
MFRFQPVQGQQTPQNIKKAATGKSSYGLDTVWLLGEDSNLEPSG